MEAFPRRPGYAKRYATQLMAYLTSFHSVDPSLLDGDSTFAQIMKAATLVGHCSHYLAGDPRFAALLDDGHPIPDTSHRLVDPHFRLPAELPEIRTKLNDLLNEVGDDDWVTGQINGFINACATCIESKTAMVVTLG